MYQDRRMLRVTAHFTCIDIYWIIGDIKYYIDRVYILYGQLQ